jgi:subtilisin family serine protease
MKEYIVTLKKDVNYDEFYDQMVEQNSIAHIPFREVEVANERPLSQRNTHYFLTEQEAEILKSDERVLAVDIPPDQRDDIAIGFNITQNSNFSKSSYSSGNQINWGLLRSSKSINLYPSDTTSPTLCAYSYHLDGEGVDVVIHDSGVQIDHPEFTDSKGNSRVNKINWYTASGVPGTQASDSLFYRDYDGHGTHVTGIVAGKNYGWAKNAQIYVLKVEGLEGSGDVGNGIDVVNCFDVIKGWHLNKPVDSRTGKKRPTVVNMSWGYSNTYTSLTGGNYRGTNWTGTTPIASYGIIFFNRVPVRVESVDVDLEELIDAGVTVCIASGNSSYKIDLQQGIDYNNYFEKSGGNRIYYHRGSSPYSTRAIEVGHVNSTMLDFGAGLQEYKASSSNGGPGVDIYAPGIDIKSAMSNINVRGSSSSTYFQNASYKQALLDGTSMASPQVAGVCALYLQLNQDATPSQVKQFIIQNSVKDLLYDTITSSDDYTNAYCLFGSNNRYLYFPFCNDVGLQFSNNLVYGKF